MRKNLTVVTKVRPDDLKVLQGLLMRNPETSLSTLIRIAIETFCYERRDAAEENEITIETNVSQKAPV